MKILFREPINQPLRIMDIENELAPIQKLIGGYIQVVDMGHGVLCIMDEEGRMKGLGNNFFHDKYGWIVGNVIFCGQDGEEFTSLTEIQAIYLQGYLGIPIED